MNKSYSSLQAVATVFTVLGWIQMVGGAIFLFFCISVAQNNQYSPEILLLYMVGTVIITLLLVVLFWGIAQILRLAIDVAHNVENINDNIYLIASKIEKYTV